MRTSALTRRVLIAGLAAITLSSSGALAQQDSGPDATSDGPAVPEGGGRADATPRTYIVTMADNPTVTYDGGTVDIASTKPAAGERIATGSVRVNEYRTYLRTQQEVALERAGVEPAARLYDYTVALNGMAVRLTGEQADALRAQPGVISLVADERHPTDTVETSDLLGLTSEDGPWAQGHLGHDVVIGMIDTGIWPEHPSFCDTVPPQGAAADAPRECVDDADSAYEPLTHWWGGCEAGERFADSDCDRKLVGARAYNEGFGGDDAIAERFTDEYLSPRDANGHGTLTAAIAAGNAQVPAAAGGRSLGLVSGMAPAARLAAYKACWGTDEGAGCYTSDALAAIDDAVADGVDVINYPIAGAGSDLLDPVSTAFFNATAAGIFVATSAGNGGPETGSVNHPAPWVTTVAAATHPAAATGTVHLGDGTEVSGRTWQTAATDELPLVYGGDAARRATGARDAALCLPGSLDPQLVEGAIVMCDRGETARVSKSRVVAAAGARAMILANVSPSTLHAEEHEVPTVHVDYDDRGVILEMLRTTEEPTAQLDGRQITVDERAPQLADLSARGPAEATSDLLKPDLVAPGIDVIGATAGDGDAFGVASGTSLSAAHLAGLAAVVMDANPDWSPAAVKSALMTTATRLGRSTPLGAGSGMAGAEALEPGLVYDADAADFLGFLCGTGRYTNREQCEALRAHPADLNQPNVALGALAGERTITREVTNVGPAGVYEADVRAPDGIDVAVRPQRLELGEGEKATYQITARPDGAPLDEWAFGRLTWSDGTHDVTSRLAVRPTAMSAPGHVSARGPQGKGALRVELGYDGAYEAVAHPLVPSRRHEGVVATDPFGSVNDALDATGSAGVSVHEVRVPRASALARFALFDETTSGDDDLDLYVFDPGMNFIGSSTGSSSNEHVDVPAPIPGRYTVVVHGWATDGPQANYTLFDWVVPEVRPGADAQARPEAGTLNIAEAPRRATTGATATVRYAWQVPESGERYLGMISHRDGPAADAATIVDVTTD